MGGRAKFGGDAILFAGGATRELVETPRAELKISICRAAALARGDKAWHGAWVCESRHEVIGRSGGGAGGVQYVESTARWDEAAPI
jgi:hypothetical protein